MTAELKEVILKVEKLPEEEQKEIAKMLNDEIKWNSSLQKSEKELNMLAEEALAEHLSGKTSQADW